MKAFGWLGAVLSMVASLYGAEAPETLLRRAIKEADSGKYTQFLQQVDQSLKRSWTIKSIVMQVEPEVVGTATLREIARRFAAAPKSQSQEVQRVGWRFFVKCVLSRSGDNSFIHHSVLYACWLTLGDRLKDTPSQKQAWDAVEKHFGKYRERLRQLRQQYGSDIPLRETKTLGKEMLLEIRAIVRQKTSIKFIR